MTLQRERANISAAAATIPPTEERESSPAEVTTRLPNAARNLRFTSGLSVARKKTDSGYD